MLQLSCIAVSTLKVQVQTMLFGPIHLGCRSCVLDYGPLHNTTQPDTPPPWLSHHWSPSHFGTVSALRPMPLTKAHKDHPSRHKDTADLYRSRVGRATLSQRAVGLSPTGGLTLQDKKPRGASPVSEMAPSPSPEPYRAVASMITKPSPSPTPTRENGSAPAL